MVYRCEIVAPSLVPRRPRERRKHDRKDATELALVDYKVDRREELDRRIEALALDPAFREAVGRLVLVTEIGDFRRFGSPGKLMAYVGLVPSEHSSGASLRQGGITKGGQQPRSARARAGWREAIGSRPGEVRC